MIEFLTGLNRAKKLAMAFGLEGFEASEIEYYKNRYDEIIVAGFTNLENTKSRIYKKDEKKMNL